MYVDIMRWGYSVEELGRSVLLSLQTFTLVDPFTTKAAKSSRPEMATFFPERPKAAMRKGCKKMRCIL